MRLSDYLDTMPCSLGLLMAIMSLVGVGFANYGGKAPF